MKKDIIKKLFLVGIMSLSLVSCGGGGGGGSSPEKENNDTTNNNTQQDKIKIPEQLTAAMDLTLEQNGIKIKLDITSPTQCVDVTSGVECAIHYVRTGERTAVLSVTPAGASPYEIKLTLTSANGGTYELENGSAGSFVLTGLDENTDGTDNNGEGGEETSPDDDITGIGLAPATLPVGKVLEFSHGSSTVYQYKILSENAVIVEGATCSAEYIKNGKNTATLKVVVSGVERIWELTFRDESGGNAQYNSAGSVYDEYTFCLSDGGSSEPSSDDNDDSSDDGSDNTDTEVPDDENTPEDDLPDDGFAPKSLPVDRDLIIQSANGEAIVFRMTSSDSAQFGNETGKVKYELLSPDSALFEYMGKTGTQQYILEFSSPSAGMAKNKLTDTKSSFSIGKYASPAPSPGDDDSDGTPEDTTPGDDDSDGTPEDTTPGDDDSHDTPVNPDPVQPEYLAPAQLTNMKFSKYGEYYLFVRGMEYSTGYQVFTGGWYDYKRTGLTTGTLSFRNAFYRSGGVYFETQKSRESSSDIKLTFSKTSGNKLKVKMEGWVREEVTEYDRSEFPVDINSTTNSIRVYGEYDVTP